MSKAASDRKGSAEGPGGIGWILLAALCARLTVGQGPSVTELVHTLEATEAACRSIAVRLHYEFSAVNGHEVKPPLTGDAHVIYRDGQGWAEIMGPDVDMGMGLADSRPSSRKLRRMYETSGVIETLDLATGARQRHLDAFEDLFRRGGRLGPEEFYWSFFGIPRSEILKKRKVALKEIAGPRGRVIEASASKPAGFSEALATQVFVFEFAERWGWLPQRIRLLDGDALLGEVVVEEVHTTKLGYFPARGRMTKVLPHHKSHPLPGPLETTGSYRFEEPIFAGVQVPASLDMPESVPASRRVLRLGTLEVGALTAGSHSSGIHMAMRTREEDLIGLVEGAMRATNGRPRLSPGRPSWRRVLRDRTWIICAFAVPLALLLAYKKRIALLAVLTLVLLMLGAISYLPWKVQPDDRTWKEQATNLGPVSAETKSTMLCGVDCLFLAYRLAGLDGAPSYETLVRLVGPGSHGTDLEAMRMVDACVADRLRPCGGSEMAEPPGLFIAHLPSSHFVLILHADEDNVVVVDAFSGLWRVPWRVMRSAVSPIGLMMT